MVFPTKKCGEGMLVTHPGGGMQLCLLGCWARQMGGEGPSVRCCEKHRTLVVE